MALVTLLASYCKYPFISVPLFGVGVYSSMLKDKDIFKVPFSILMVVALMLICAFITIFSHNADAAHGVLNSIIIIGMLLIVYILNHVAPLYKLAGFLVSGTYVLYLTHFKVLDLMTTLWGYIPFWSWMLLTIVVTGVFTTILRKLHLA